MSVSKLPQEAQVVGPVQPDVVDGVLELGDALRPMPKAKPLNRSGS